MADGGKAFLPVHAELRGQYWLSDQAFPATFSGFVFVSGGIAQIDAQGTARVTEDRSVPPPPAQLDNPDEQTLTVYKKMGLSFAAIGAGVYLPFAERHGAVVRLESNGPVSRLGRSLPARARVRVRVVMAEHSVRVTSNSVAAAAAC